MKNDNSIEGYVYTCEFVYGGCGKREYFGKEFTAVNGDDLNKQVNEYVKNQNAGEPKSDRIISNGVIKRVPIHNANQTKIKTNEQ